MGPGEGAVGTQKNTVLGCCSRGGFKAAEVYVDDDSLNVDAPGPLGLHVVPCVIVPNSLPGGVVEFAVSLLEFIV